ncbi:methicillin resistance protein [Bifidobacterium italicum]|uniref:Methicillin resistance protein n=1 Tax=Bifidobacterium italicum TaxID=1960968 RepID=A0A2A2EJR4_9BIFI|nr:methicillin resistance protein [Bifidobacterium italicum]
MITIERVSPQAMEREADANGIELPIEQTSVWADFQTGVEGRTPWGCLIIRDGNAIVAVVSLIDMETHGYHYLRSVHGPVWKSKPDERLEQAVIAELVDFVRTHDKHVAFLRIDTWSDKGTYPVLSTVPYNETVVLDITGGDEALLARMKKRGRRDVRKALRESPAVCADETEIATKDFADYYAVMVETARRDGFTPAPMSDYTDMIKALGPDHCRVFGARIDGKVVAWTIVTLQGKTGVYYYASMLTSVKRQHVPDKLLYTVACTLGQMGYEKLDLMGIGNDFAPSLKSLNEFKTKFADDTTTIAAGRDVPIKKLLYRSLRLLQDVRRALRPKKHGNAEKAEQREAARKAQAEAQAQQKQAQPTKGQQTQRQSAKPQQTAPAKADAKQPQAPTEEVRAVRADAKQQDASAQPQPTTQQAQTHTQAADATTAQPDVRQASQAEKPDIAQNEDSAE